MLTRVIFAGLIAIGFAGAAQAAAPIPSDIPYWRGFYIGGNVGGAWNSTCDNWSLNDPASNDPMLVSAFTHTSCPNNGAFIGGAQIGYNFQYDRWVWGIGLDYDQWHAKNRTRSFNNFPGLVPTFPSGTATFTGEVSPNGFAILGPRVGYAFGNVLPYVRAGGVYAGGSRTSTATYTATGDASPDAYFSGGKDFKSSGYGVGAGVDFLINDHWFLRVEYTHVNLGKGTNTATHCSSAGTAEGTAICARFDSDALELSNIHSSFNANIARFGVNYKFGSRPYVAPAAPPATASAPPPPPPALPPPCNPPPGFKADADCNIIERSVVVRAVDFEFDSTRLTTPAQQTLDEVATALLAEPELIVEVQGHADSVGSYAYNLNLSRKRAKVVKAYLVSKGLADSALTAQGYGKTKPIASNATVEGRAKNRRVEFMVTNAPEHVKVVTEDATRASTEAAEQKK